jgi:hypothetical protein
VSVGVPVAVTLNEAVLPYVTLWLTGGTVMTGGEFTVMVTGLLAVDWLLPSVTNTRI